MAKYIEQVAGQLKEKSATVVSTGPAQAGDIVSLDPTGKLDPTVLPTGVGPDTSSIEASENLNAGDLVNVFNDASTPKVRKADATIVGKEADGFVLSAVTSGANALVYFEGVNTALSGLVPGAKLFLDTTAGGVTDTAPSTGGNVLQKVGRAISATAMTFEPGQGIELA